MTYVRKCKYECGTQIRDFDEKERKYKEYPSGIIHTKERCQQAKKILESQPQNPPQQQQQQQQQNKAQSHLVVDQDQKSKDIKDAQLERKRQHVELIKNLQWNTKMLAHVVETQGGKQAREILDSMGFEEFQEEQRQEGYEDL